MPAVEREPRMSKGYYEPSPAFKEPQNDKLKRLARLGATRRMLEREFIALYVECFGCTPVGAEGFE